MLYDVFVVGAKDPSPVAQMHLAADLAKHFQAPVADVAQAISTRNLRAGKAMDEAQARILSQQLATFGAVTELRPAVSPPRNRVPTQTNVRSSPTGEMGMPTLPTLVTTPGSDVVGRDPFSTFSQLPAVTSSSMPAVHGPPTLSGPTNVTSRAPTMVGSRSVSGARNPFNAPDETSPRLELARPTSVGGRPVSETAEVPRVRPHLAGSSGMDHMRLAADSTVSGVEVAADSGNPHSVRCVKHGLYYDQRTASGCRKCLEPAKQTALKIERNALGFRLMALRDNPARRAGYGLTLALALGFIPAAWHALSFGRAEVQSLRAEQAVLSQKVGTEEVIKRYHSLDQHITDVHGKQRRNTAIVWVVIASGALAAWYRLT